MEYIINNTSLPCELRGCYSKLKKGSSILYIKLDENLTPIYSINQKNGFWELQDLATKMILAINDTLKTNTWKLLQQQKENKPVKSRKRKTVGDDDTHVQKKVKQENTKRSFGQTLQQNTIHTVVIKEEDNIINHDNNSDDEKNASINRSLLEESEHEFQADLNVKRNHFYAPGYIQEIMKFLRDNEKRYLPSTDYMNIIQTDIKPNMRYRLLDWLVDVYERFEIQTSTFHLAVNLLDRYLSKISVHRNRLQLLGCVVLWLASKYNEIRVPEINAFVHMSDGAFQYKDMLDLEESIINELNFDFSAPTAHIFGDRYIHIVSFYLETEKTKRRLKHLVHYYLEYCLLDYNLVGLKPSLMGAAATYAAASWLDRRFEWDSHLEKETGYTKEDLNFVVTSIREIYSVKKEGIITAVYRKYSGEEKGGVSLMKYKTSKNSQP